MSNISRDNRNQIQIVQLFLIKIFPSVLLPGAGDKTRGNTYSMFTMYPIHR